MIIGVYRSKPDFDRESKPAEWLYDFAPPGRDMAYAQPRLLRPNPGDKSPPTTWGHAIWRAYNINVAPLIADPEARRRFLMAMLSKSGGDPTLDWFLTLRACNEGGMGKDARFIVKSLYTPRH